MSAGAWRIPLRPARKGVRSSRLTKAGVMLILVALGIGSAAYNTSSNILYLALAMLLATLLVSGVLSLQNFRRMRYQLLLEPHMRVGQPTPVRLRVENRKRWVPTYGLTLTTGTREEGARKRLHLDHGLDPGGAQVLEWLYTPAQRGPETFVMLGVDALFPFGFLRRSMRSDGPRAKALVWPARVDYTFEVTHAGRHGTAGTHARSRGDGPELAGLRGYRPGDPARQVHWKASARLGRLLVRENAEERDDAYAVWVDAQADTWRDAEAFEQMCAVAASLAEDLFMQGRLSRAGVSGEGLVPLRTLGDLHAFLDSLARLEPQGEAGPVPGVRRLITFAPQGKRVGIYLEGHAAGSN